MPKIKLPKHNKCKVCKFIINYQRTSGYCGDCYFKSPQVRKKQREYSRAYSKTKEYKRWLKEYNSRPYVIQKKRKYYQRPSVVKRLRKYRKEYYQKNKEKINKYNREHYRKKKNE